MGAMTEFDVTAIGVVGSGLMGTGIAEVAALAGYPAVLVKATSGPLDPVRDRLARSLQARVAKGALSAVDCERALAGITVSADRDALGGADLVIESIVEDLADKRTLFEDL